LEEKKKLKFSDIDSQSDLEKEIDGELIEDTVKKEADLYHKTLYTVIPKTHDHSLGIFPNDQGLTNAGVLAWDTIKGIPTSLLDIEYKVIKVTLNDTIIRDNLRPVGGSTYILKHIPNTLPMEEANNISFNGE